MRFIDFHSHATNINRYGISENPISVEISDIPEKMQLELIELQYDSILCSSFNQEASITLYVSLPVFRFFELCTLA
jgi:hypothetical protein